MTWAWLGLFLVVVGFCVMATAWHLSDRRYEEFYWERLRRELRDDTLGGQQNAVDEG